MNTTGTTDEHMLKEIWRALATVFDPCSVAVSDPMSVVEMGLVRKLDIDASRNVSITLSSTSACCLFIGGMALEVERRLGSTPNVGRVTVDVDPSYVWSENDMQPDAHARLDERRRRIRMTSGITPYALRAPQSARSR